jgi:hypothetical protein
VATDDEQQAGGARPFMTTMKTLTVAALIALSLTSAAPGAFAQEGPAPPSDAVRPAVAQRFRNYLSDVAGPVVLIETIGWAAAAQANGTPTEWRGGARSFGKRYASLVGQGVIQESVTYALSEALAVDSHFHKSHKHGFFPRAGDALIQAVTSRRANGNRVVSAPLLAGYAAGGLGMMTWFPDGYTNKDGLRYGGLALTSRAGVNLIREFITHR